ncbi:MAG: hypothetical protein J7L19_05375 [Dehalococcoidia bacterium]|nr:hypothetical protein [Dehalococcoidia bacterium]
MNCAVCGNPVLCGRAIFHCSCGVFVHAHCWEKHVAQAHQPTFKIGVIDLSGEFIANKEEEQVGSQEEEQEGEHEAIDEQVTQPVEQGTE